MKPKVLVTRKIPGKGIEVLKKKFDVDVWDRDCQMPREELLRRVSDKEGLLCMLNDSVDEEVFMVAPKLKVVSNYAVGYNNIDVEKATEYGVVVTNTPGVLTETVADLAFGLIIAVARRIVEADRFVREGRFTGMSPFLFLGTDVHGKTIGIVGLGRIGSAIARRAKGFGMKVLYFSRTRKENLERELQAEYRSLEELLRESDFVVLCVPLTKQTYHMIGEREISLMKKSAFLINIARGPVVDENALIKALAEGKIAGAGLDVYENEPFVPEELRKHKNVVLTPHIGSASRETREKMADIAVQNLADVLEGRWPRFVVNPDVRGRSRAGL